jgi:hypothetical protein
VFERIAKEWGQIVRLVQWCQRDKALQAGHDTMVDQDWTVLVRPAMNNTVPDSYGVDRKLVPQPSASDIPFGRNGRHWRRP